MVQIMPSIPRDQRARVAQFLEKQGFKEQALVVSTDSDHRFDLALNLGVSPLSPSVCSLSGSICLCLRFFLLVLY